MQALRILGCYILTNMIFLSLTMAQAQQDVYVPPPKRDRDWKPSMVFLSTDVIGMYELVTSDDYKTEYQAKVDFDSYFFTVDFGHQKNDVDQADFSYQAKGYFSRVGVQADFLPFNKNYNNFYFGFMYGWSRSEDNIRYQDPDTRYALPLDEVLNLENDKIKASWFEANLGLSVHIIGPIYMGYVLRFKFAPNIKGTDGLYPWEIPGYGRADRTGRFEFNYHITYRLGFRDKKVPLRPTSNK